MSIRPSPCSLFALTALTVAIAGSTAEDVDTSAWVCEYYADQAERFLDEAPAQAAEDRFDGTPRAGPVMAGADVEGAGQPLRLIEAESGGSYAIGATSVSDDTAMIGNGTGYDEEGVYANLDAQGRKATDRHRLRWNIEDLGLNSRVVNVGAPA